MERLTNLWVPSSLHRIHEYIHYVFSYEIVECEGKSMHLLR